MKTAVIIGAGPAGLTAAYTLLGKGGAEWKVTVVEAMDAIGGISRTLEHNGNRFDIGPLGMRATRDLAFGTPLREGDFGRTGGGERITN